MRAASSRSDRVTSTSAVSSSVVHLEDQFDDCGSGFGVEIAGGFIGKENVRAIDESASQRHALLFAAAQLRRIMTEMITRVRRGLEVVALRTTPLGLCN